MIALWLSVALAHAPGTSWSVLGVDTVDASFTDVAAAAAFADDLVLHDATGPCRLGVPVHLAKGGLFLVRVEHRCIGTTTMRWDALTTLEPGHRHLVRGADGLVALSASSPSTSARPLTRSWWSSMATTLSSWWVGEG